jgi:hypothetical protein
VRRDEPYIALQPGASSPSRQWPASSFAELARLFAEAGLKVVIVGSAGEAKLATGIVRWSRDAAVSLCGDTDVPTLAAILQGAQRLISNDTGTIHLAAAVGTPTVGIYVGPASAKDTAPYGEGHLVTEPDLECAPCGYHDLCMRPACQSVIRPADIFALAAAKREDVARVASAMAGARVYLTHLSSSAGYSIELLNAPHHPSAVGRLQFYRRLWDDLLSPSDGGRAVRADGHREDSTERRQAAGALEAIAREAEQALAESRSAGRAVTSSLPASRILERQLPWQRKLQAFARSDDLLAPLARVALIRMRYARLRATEEFCQDMQAAVNLLSRGARLAYLRRVHAGAEASEYV